MMPKCSDSGNLDFYWELILRPFAMAVCLEQVAAGGTGRLLLSARRQKFSLGCRLHAWRVTRLAGDHFNDSALHRLARSQDYSEQLRPLEA